MKKVLLVFLISLLAQTGFSVLQDNILDVKLSKYEPAPVEAGNVFNVWIKAENKGAETIKNASFIFTPQYPFTLSDNVKNYGKLRGFEDIELEYRIFVSKEALNGTYKFKLRYTNDGSVFFEKEFPITIKKSYGESDLDVFLIEGNFHPLTKSNLVIEVANRDKATAYYTLVTAQTDVAEIKRKEIYVGNLKSDDFDSVEFELDVKNITGIFPVNITMTYKDDNSKSIKETDIVFIKVTKKPEIKIETPVWYYAIYLILLIILIKWISPLIISKFKRK